MVVVWSMASVVKRVATRDLAAADIWARRAGSSRRVRRAWAKEVRSRVAARASRQANGMLGCAQGAGSGVRGLGRTRGEGGVGGRVIATVFFQVFGIERTRGFCVVVGLLACAFFEPEG